MKNSIARFICGVAVTIAAVGILASLIIGFVFIDNELTVGIGWGILVGGLISTVTVFSVLLGISELVEKSEEQSLYLYKLYSAFKAQSKSNSASNTHSWRCESCGNMISTSPCPYCKK